MALIKEKIIKKDAIKIDIDHDVHEEIIKYCKFAGVNSIAHFFEQAAIYVFSKDKDWGKYLKDRKKKSD